MARRPFCKPKNVAREIRYLSERIALVEAADHACYAHKFKPACESVKDRENIIGKKEKDLRRELEYCLGK